MTTMRWVLAPLIPALAALMLTPVATADITADDQQFLNALAQGPWWYLPDPVAPENAAVRLAHDQCKEISMKGWTPGTRQTVWSLPAGPASLRPCTLSRWLSRSTARNFSQWSTGDRARAEDGANGDHHHRCDHPSPPSRQR